jgi:hypothetical protein
MAATRRSDRPAYAVVVGIDLNGLGVLRALGGAGVPVLAIDTDLEKATAATAYGVKLKVNDLAGERLVDDLLALRSRFESSPVLFLTQEASVATVSAARKRLQPAYRFSLPDHARMEGSPSITISHRVP